MKPTSGSYQLLLDCLKQIEESRQEGRKARLATQANHLIRGLSGDSASKVARRSEELSDLLFRRLRRAAARDDMATFHIFYDLLKLLEHSYHIDSEYRLRAEMIRNQLCIDESPIAEPTGR